MHFFCCRSKKKYNLLCRIKINLYFCSTEMNQKKYKAMKTSIYDFRFEFVGYGHYRVTYTSHKTGKQWSNTITDMTLIDSTKNAEEPKRKDLEDLKRMCKQ